MIISTVKDCNVYTIKENRLNRPEFGEKLKDITNIGELKKEIADTLSTQGRVYGIYKKKELVGVYIFEKKENYFIEKEDSGIKLGNHEFDFDKFWFGSCTSAFCFKKSICLDEIKDYIKKIEKDLEHDLTDQIEFGIVGGVEWNDQLIYQKHLEKKPNNGIYSTIGFLGGWALGFWIGFTIFNEWWMGLCFGASYSVLWGGCGIAIADKSVIDTLYFVNQEHNQN